MSASKLLINLASNNVHFERKCDICIQPILATQDYIGCSGCRNWCHIRCKKITPIQLQKLVTSSEWFCSNNCKTTHDAAKKVPDPENAEGPVIPDNPTIKDLYMMMVNFNTKNDNEFKVIKSSVTATSEKCDQNTQHLQQQIHDLQQIQHRNSFIVKNVPVKKDEDVISIVQRLGQIVKCSVGLNDIEAYRVRPYNKTTNVPLIVVNCASYNVKKKYMDAFKLCGVVLYQQIFADISKNESMKEIKVCEYLTPFFHKLLSDSREIKSLCKFKHVWFKNCKILFRKTDDSKILSVRNFEQLVKLKAKLQNVDADTGGQQ